MSESPFFSEDSTNTASSISATSSTTSTSQNVNSNITQQYSTNTVVTEAYLKQYINDHNVKRTTPAQIRATGEMKLKMGILWFVGVICILLIIIGGVAFLVYPDNAKDVWVIIGPIISASITGTVAYFTGDNNGSKK